PLLIWTSPPPVSLMECLAAPVLPGRARGRVVARSMGPQAAAQLRPEQPQMHMAAVELRSPEHLARQGVPIRPNGVPVLPRSPDSLEPTRRIAAIRVLDQVEEQVGGNTTRGERGRKVHPEVPDLVAHPIPGHCWVPGYAQRRLHVLEHRVGQVADVPARSDESRR